MNGRTKQRSKITLILLTILISTTMLSTIFQNQGTQGDYKNTISDEYGKAFDFEGNDNYFPESSEITHINNKYDLSLWWNKTYRFRIGFVLEETEGIDRYQPVDVFFTFREDEHYENTERLLGFNRTGNDEWSDPLPMQMWNISKYPTTNFIESCTITFIANVSANENSTYFLYYNENNAGIEQKIYNTGFTSEKLGLTLTVTVGNEYQVILEQGLASTKLIRENIDYHQDESLAPEKQLSDPSLKFLAHFENSVSDSTGNEPDGVINGDPQYSAGIVQYGMDFDGNDFVSYTSGLEDSGEPFNGLSTEFTACMWINPDDLSGGATNHQTENVILAKAHDTYNDNFEMGVNNEGNIHVYLDTGLIDTFADFSPPGTITTTGGWYFVAFRYQQGTTEVRIVQINNPSNPNNDIWWSMPNWNGASDIDQANGSPFTIGASEHIDQFFKGMIDEVAIYNKYLSNQEVEDFKYGSMSSSIQTITELENGDVFSSYEIEWTTAFDMHVQDTCTFYYDYELWNLERNIYFENEFNYTIDRMFALNTNYNFTGVDDHNELAYIYDGIIQKDITSAGFMAENYTVVHNAPDASKDAIGIFIEGYELSDPAHTSITYLRGDVIYDSGFVEFLPGSLNDFDNSVGNESYQLKINFWELAGSVNKSGVLDNAGIIQYFDDTLLSLREKLDLYIFQQDSLFYSIDVNVTDIDGNIVPGATVTVWNATNHAIFWTQDTDAFGRTIFKRFENGIYDVNVSYAKYGQILTITTPKVIELNESTVNTFGVYYLSFTDVKLTSLELKFEREDLGIIQEDVVGANITFSIDEGSGPVVLGYELTNSTGVAIFRWANLTDLASGNVSLTVNWHGENYEDLACSDDLNPSDIASITLPFYQYLYTRINVSTGNTYKSFLLVNTTGTEGVMLGDTLNLWLNYTQQKNVDPILPIEGGTVNYNIKIGIIQINTGVLKFTEIGNGVYSLSIDTSNPVETGGVDWMSSTTYTMEITASKPGYITNQTSITFTLLDKTTFLSASDTAPQVFYNDLISFDIHYTDIYAEPDEDIDGATVQFVAIGVTGVNGYLTPYGSGGLYSFDLDSSVFPTHGDYILQITAFKQNYETQTIYLPLSIEEINTRLNNSAAIYDTYNVYIGTSRVFYFEYTIESSGVGLSDVSLSQCSWEKEVKGVIIDSGVMPLNSMGNGIYELDLDTETLKIATYSLVIKIGETNYVERDAILFLNIIPRDMGVDVEDIISVVSGNAKSIEIDLIDVVDNSPLLGAQVALELKGIPFGNFTDNGDGSYTIYIPDSALPDTFFVTELVEASISIFKANYSQKIKPITIEVTITEIFPGFPMFYFLMILGALIAVVGSLVISRQIRRARIPTFVKKAKEMGKNIKGRKVISDLLLYPSKEEYVIKKLGDKWEMLDLSLEEILGHNAKKKKNLSINEFEGGGT